MDLVKLKNLKNKNRVKSNKMFWASNKSHQNVHYYFKILLPMKTYGVEYFQSHKSSWDVKMLYNKNYI